MDKVRQNNQPTFEIRDSNATLSEYSNSFVAVFIIWPNSFNRADERVNGRVVVWFGWDGTNWCTRYAGWRDKDWKHDFGRK